MGVPLPIAPDDIPAAWRSQCCVPPHWTEIRNFCNGVHIGSAIKFWVHYSWRNSGRQKESEYATEPGSSRPGPRISILFDPETLPMPIERGETSIFSAPTVQSSGRDVINNISRAKKLPHAFIIHEGKVASRVTFVVGRSDFSAYLQQQPYDLQCRWVLPVPVLLGG